jgi:hypothetical protein
VPSIRKNFKAERVPSEDGDAVVPVDISSHLNLSKDSKVFGVNFTSLKTGQVNKGTKLFNLINTSANCAIAVGSVGTERNYLPIEVSAFR